MERLFGERSSTVKTFIFAHANGSAPRNNAVIYNYIIRIAAGDARLCRMNDPVHAARIGAACWPDQDAVEEPYWPLWRKWSAWQRVAVGQEAAAVAVPTPVPTRPRSAPPESPLAPRDADEHDRFNYRAAVLEHLLIGELLRHLWPTPLEVCKPQVGAVGYDLILQCRGILRHVQLKSSPAGGDTRTVKVCSELEQRRGGCVIWTQFDKQTMQMAFWWLGGAPGEPLPELPAGGIVEQSRFRRVGSVPELLQLLFGSSRPVKIPAPTMGEAPAQLARYIQSLEGFRLERSPAGNYNHMGATIAEVILQAGIDYRSVVVPRVQNLLRLYPEAATTSGFLSLLDKRGSEAVLDFRGEKPQRVRSLALFLSYEGVETEAELRHWLQRPDNLTRLRALPGVGPKTVDYLQILVGISTSAVDRHLAQFLANAGIAASTYEERQQVIRETAKLLGQDEAVLDYGIWLYMSDRSR